VTEKARAPEDLTRLFVERARAGDAAGIAALYEEDGVLAYPPGRQTVGRQAIQQLFEHALARMPNPRPEEPRPTLMNGDLALTSTLARDGAGERVQVARRQPDGTWLRVLDQPELIPLELESKAR
jgi:ketosteroid isomerase-like protein